MVIVLLLAPPQLLLLLIVLRGACSGCASRFTAHLCSISGPMASTHVLPRDVDFFVEGVGVEPWHIPLRTTDVQHLVIRNPLALRSISHINFGEHAPIFTVLGKTSCEVCHAGMGGTPRG